MASLHLPFDPFFFQSSCFFFFFFRAKVLINLVKEIFCSSFLAKRIWYHINPKFKQGKKNLTIHKLRNKYQIHLDKKNQSKVSPSLD